jgi:hypothetical protein
MKIINAMFATFLVTMAVHSAAPQTPASNSWSAATYHGLVMGKSTREDVFKVLGKPKWAGSEPDTGVPIMSYDVADPLPGELEVYTTKGILESMTLNLKEKVSQEGSVLFARCRPFTLELAQSLPGLRPARARPELLRGGSGREVAMGRGSC